MRFSDEFIAAVRERNDIQAVVSAYVDLRPHGGYLSGLCPFHNEKTPSFVVYEKTQSFYCFGCGVGGDVISFIRNIEGVGYPEAVTRLAERSGLPLPQDGYDDSVAKQRRRILDANRDAARFYHNVLMSENGKVALEYFKNRQISDAMIKRFGLGYAPDSWDALTRYLRKLGYKDEELLAADLSVKSRKGSLIDKFRNRVMFPIIDIMGSVVAFGGRVLDDSKPKYVNTSDTLAYKKGQGIFALNLAKNSADKTLILCEGYLDVISYHQAGFSNAIACLGTAFTQEQAKLISKYSEQVILSYDNDDAGRKATVRTKGILAQCPVKVKIAVLSGGKDPDEIIRKYGKEYMTRLLDNAVNDIEYDLINARQGKKTFESDDERLSYLNKAVNVLSEYNDPIKIDLYTSRLALEFDVSKEAIEKQLEREKNRKIRKSNSEIFDRAKSIATGRNDTGNPERKNNTAAANAEEHLIVLLINNPDFYEDIKDLVSENDFVTSVNKRIFSVITQRLSEGRSVELSFLAGDLSNEEMSYLTGICLRVKVLANTKRECIDCINVLKSEKSKREAKKASEMTDDEFLRFFSDKE